MLYVCSWLQMGQTPVDEAEGSVKAFLRTFEVSICTMLHDCLTHVCIVLFILEIHV